LESLLSKALGSDTHDPFRQEETTATTPLLPCKRLHSIALGIGLTSELRLT
jgi:hypothetical protein